MVASTELQMLTMAIASDTKWDQVATRQAGMFNSMILNFFLFDFVRVFLPSPISIIIIVEYSTISLLGYFGDTLANVGLPESSLECDSNFMTRIENKYVRCESNRIKKSN